MFVGTLDSVCCACCWGISFLSITISSFGSSNLLLFIGISCFGSRLKLSSFILEKLIFI